MGIKDIVQHFGEKAKQRKELLNEMEQRYRLQKIVEDRQKSSNERELEGFQKRRREKYIKEQLDVERKRFRDEINFGANPLNVKNITAKTQWNVLREKNQFKNNGCMFTNQKSVIKGNKKLLKSDKKLLKGGKKLFRI